MTYSSSRYITENLGNNALSFSQRKVAFGEAKIYVPSLKKIGTVEEVQLGKEVVIEEVDEHGVIRSYSGLAHIYHLNLGNTPIYIFDNHHHALYFWIMRKQSHKTDEPISIHHIDQHSDLNIPDTALDQNMLNDKTYLYKYVNHECQISNFIHSFLDCTPNAQFQWIKTQEELLDLPAQKSNAYILDIDLDFRAPEMNTSQIQGTLARTKELISQASLVTLASSPMFIDQSTALDILHKLFTHD